MILYRYVKIVCTTEGVSFQAWLLALGEEQKRKRTGAVMGDVRGVDLYSHGAVGANGTTFGARSVIYITG